MATHIFKAANRHDDVNAPADAALNWTEINTLGVCVAQVRTKKKSRWNQPVRRQATHTLGCQPGCLCWRGTADRLEERLQTDEIWTLGSDVAWNDSAEQTDTIKISKFQKILVSTDELC